MRIFLMYSLRLNEPTLVRASRYLMLATLTRLSLGTSTQGFRERVKCTLDLAI